MRNAIDIFLSKEADKQIKKLHPYLLKQYLVWVKSIKRYGYDIVKSSHRYKDHILKGKWKGYRAFRLSYSYRVIYKTHKDGDIQIIKVERISKHDYKKR